ncbi:endonuclease/exonuclease/phosphatase family protein [Phragmitibacter flavus]|uniref:Endonuclease/exonuclease/phosphatase family protein n=1 Tax=Phragmitibacter flavus TaxID=2576071 RepID=A0A5R8KJB6_9BACT|nr:endonuclease/exonuclease/phosphatase family protein [Phragmitibacter flavus]TLD72025.1 endonuclease/exonuclease/phosphatase family protein [Phragmitibacter flavus]
MKNPLKQRPQWIGHLPRVLHLLACVGLGLLTLAALATPWAEWVGQFEKFTHLVLQEALAAAMLGAYFAFQKRWKRAALASCLAAGFAWPMARYSIPVSQPLVSADAQTATMMVFNVYRKNRTPEKVLAALLKEDLDVLFLTEVTDEWAQLLKPLADRYPHQLAATPYGNWLLSKHPMEKTEIVLLDFEHVVASNETAGKARVPEGKPKSESWGDNELMVATLLINGKRIRIGAIHPPTPVNRTKRWQQKAQAALYQKGLLADPAADVSILAGDFNTTPFSPTFRRIVETTNLRHAAQGFGCMPTWGPRLPFNPILPVLGIPLDHFLVSDQANVMSYEVGPALGSDHRWVKMKLAFD